MVPLRLAAVRGEVSIAICTRDRQCPKPHCLLRFSRASKVFEIRQFAWLRVSKVRETMLFAGLWGVTVSETMIICMVLGRGARWGKVDAALAEHERDFHER